MRAITVCVEFSDVLAMTLPRNRHHFESVTVVTTPRDTATHDVCRQDGATIFETEAFYERGAVFNKWLALEQGLDAMGREGWLCILDADIVLPRSLGDWSPESGCLYHPVRRMQFDITKPPADESQWRHLPRHRYCLSPDFAGYCLIFDAADPVLGQPPWHQTDWRHAGGADTFFQAKWQPVKKRRTPWEVLHLGQDGQWCGRTTPMADGTEPEGGSIRGAALEQFMRERKRCRTYEHERLGVTLASE